MRPTVAEISLNALRHNLNVIRKRTGDVPLCAVVKADAYGHSLDVLADTLRQTGIENWGVHSLEEALQARRCGLTGQVIILGGVYADECDEILRNRLTPILHHIENFRELRECFSKNELFKKSAKPVAVHLKLDTGMGRLGFRPEQLKNFLSEFKDQRVFAISGVFSHLPLSEDHETTLDQRRVFESTVAQIRDAGFDPGLRHHSNSLASLMMPEMRFDLIRPGLVLYGVHSHALMEKDIDLMPVMSLVSKIISVREVPKDSGISYGYTFKTQRPSRIATIPVGYADGYPRALSNQSSVLIRGKRAPIIGRVCMDMSVVDVTDLPDVMMGDRVVLFGNDGGESLSVKEIAAWAQTIPYEILCGISPRVPRVAKN